MSLYQQNPSILPLPNPQSVWSTTWQSNSNRVVNQNLLNIGAWVNNNFALTDLSNVATHTYLVANLPNPAPQGARAMVTNSNTSTFYAVVAGGGSYVVPVYYDGTNWRVG